MDDIVFFGEAYFLHKYKDSSNQQKQFSGGGDQLIPGINLIQGIVRELIIFKIVFLKQLYNLN